MMTASKSQYQKALDKAAERKAWNYLVPTMPAPCTVWKYRGERGDYLLRLVGEDIVCSCPAGQREMPCYHAASLFILRGSERMIRRQAEREVSASASPASRMGGVLAAAGGGMRRPMWDDDDAPAFGGLGA